MARKPSDLIQFKARIHERVRRQIEAAAKKRGVTTTTEMGFRLERSFNDDNLRDLGKLVDDLKTVAHWQHHLDNQGRLLQAADRLVAEIDQLPTRSGTLDNAVAAVKQAINVIDLEHKLEARRLRAAQ